MEDVAKGKDARAMMSFVRYLFPLSLYKYAIMFGLFLASIGAILVKSFMLGASRERDKQQKQDFESIKRRIKVDDKVSKMSDDNVRDELSKWMRE